MPAPLGLACSSQGDDLRVDNPTRPFKVTPMFDVLEYVKSVQQALLDHGFNPGVIDGIFGEGTRNAVIAFQKSERLVPDGVVGPITEHRLGLRALPVRQTIPFPLDPSLVAVAFRRAALGNIKRYLPYIERALLQQGLNDKKMVAMALATIAAESAGFEPIDEKVSRYNTSPNGHHFDLYDNRKDLGNAGYPDGAMYKGRGFIQLTGRSNYAHMDEALKQKGRLINHPSLANGADIAAMVLAKFLSLKEFKLRVALAENDLRRARRLINGGTHGLNRFSFVYRRLMEVL